MMFRTRKAALTACGVFVLAVVAVLMAAGTERSLAQEPTPTPKPDTSGNLSGIYDALVHPGNKAVGLFHCITRLDHDGGTDELKVAAQCYIDTPGLSGSAVPDRADLLPGPPPPPPYATGSPTKLGGNYNSGTDTITLAGCFENVGGSLGPNVIAQVSIPNAKTAQNLGQPGSGTVLIFDQQSVVDCEALTPSGAVPEPLSINLYKAGAASESSWREALPHGTRSTDFDNDGCTDFDELSKPAPPNKCGDDPYNPYDSDENFDSVGSLQVTVVRADVCQGGQPRPDDPPPVGCDGAADGDIAAGSYFHCVTDTQHNKTTNALTVRAYCYTDNPVLTVNCQEVQGAPAKATCSVSSSACAPFGPQTADKCGDGLSGSRPPAPFGDVDGTHTVLTGMYNKTTNQIEVEGCFSGVENPLQGPNVYAQAVVDAHTGQGTVDIWTTRANCDKPATTPTFDDVAIELAEQQQRSTPTATSWDTDLDNCPDRVELGATTNGGLRDPYNRWDWFDQWTGLPANPQRDGAIVGSDISAVVGRFGAVGTPTGDPNDVPVSASGYHISGDRGGSLTGSNGWNLRAPDGSIVGADISAVVGSFGHSGCNARFP